jgi:hypothetical protein
MVQGLWEFVLGTGMLLAGFLPATWSLAGALLARWGWGGEILQTVAWVMIQVSFWASVFLVPY